MFNRVNVIKDRLSAQQEFLATLRDRHLVWAKNIDYPGAKQIHVEIAELFRQSIEKYNILLDIYHEQNK